MATTVQRGPVDSWQSSAHLISLVFATSSGVRPLLFFARGEARLFNKYLTSSGWPANDLAVHDVSIQLLARHIILTYTVGVSCQAVDAKRSHHTAAEVRLPLWAAMCKAVRPLRFRLSTLKPARAEKISKLAETYSPMKAWYWQGGASLACIQQKLSRLNVPILSSKVQRVHIVHSTQAIVCTGREQCPQRISL